MATVYFPSYPDAEVIEVEFLTLPGEGCRLKLLVDSGFTGHQSGAVVGDAEAVWGDGSNAGDDDAFGKTAHFSLSES